MDLWRVHRSHRLQLRFRARGRADGSLVKRPGAKRAK